MIFTLTTNAVYLYGGNGLCGILKFRRPNAPEYVALQLAFASWHLFTRNA